MRTSTSTTPTLITEVLRHVTSLPHTAVLNNCYSEATAYTALAYSYLATFHDAYNIMCSRHVHYQYRLQLPSGAAEHIFHKGAGPYIHATM